MMITVYIGKKENKCEVSQVWWIMPVIPATWDGRQRSGELQSEASLNEKLETPSGKND
jgi:hypothetical protein